MAYKLIENDVRLLRRILVARNLGDGPAAAKITKHLRNKGLVFTLPEEQSDGEHIPYMGRLPLNEVYLSEEYGCILLPEYSDVIFLNSKWRNPYTLFVRLVEPVPELGDYGAKYWVPSQLGLEEQFRAQAEKDHANYREGVGEVQRKGVIASIRRVISGVE
jgi:hypothetical protein